jgi:cellulose synthase/poly-beta-1,6-N-acetylglucosamine synthase-like glycosyltransferase
VSSSSPRAELLSIVVPVYNEVRTVRSVIERLIAIDLPLAREIIVVNDGSTDGTREVLDGFGIRDSGLGTRQPGAGRRQAQSESSTPNGTPERGRPFAAGSTKPTARSWPSRMRI